jgi:hypothetical protein
MDECDQEEYEGGESSDHDERLDGLEQRVEQLESASRRGEAGLSLGYAMGMTLAMILSWSRNASILWCVFHGLFSWVYVIYVAVAR